jgi:N-dimethylarginine dimethylaminohydrolase
MPQGTVGYAKSLERRGFTPVEVPYVETYKTFGSGIHCSTASIWRES